MLHGISFWPSNPYLQAVLNPDFLSRFLSDLGFSEYCMLSGICTSNLENVMTVTKGWKVLMAECGGWVGKPYFAARQYVVLSKAQKPLG